ncbi:MAG TPA: PHP domain-containing protein [Deltaproteobacteria bacterium]|nr:PHP domain-containing protein [Deltaproteobacteria bacterium]
MFIMDMHTHTAAYSPCSITDPVEHIRRAAAVGLDGICITEHDRPWLSWEWQALQRDARGLNIILLPGQEIRCHDAEGRTKGDFLIFGPEIIIERPLTPQALIGLIHERRGIVIAAHPYRGDMRFLGAGDLLYELDQDGIEVYHPHHTRSGLDKAKAAAEKLDRAATGASDAHRLEEIGTLGTIFPEPVANLEDLVRQIKAKKTTPVSMLPGWPEEEWF